MKILNLLFIFILTVGTLSSQEVRGQADPTAEYNQIASNPPNGISQSVWAGATQSFLSQINNGSNAKCVLVIAEGRQGDITSANMWIGHFLQGSSQSLWSGYASRFAVPHQNTTSVNMPTDRCKRRNGLAEVKGNEACIRDRCLDISVYRNMIDDLGLPPDVAITSFYFSTPLQKEVYKFHDFYGCSEPPCPQTLGCLGLERHTMKSLCVNYMGNNGSNGLDTPEKGGVWLYFHNMGAPPSLGSPQEAGLGLQKLKNGSACANVTPVNLASGELQNISAPNSSGISDEQAISQHYESEGVNGADLAQSLSQMSPELAKQIAEQKTEEIGELVAMCESVVVQSCPDADIPLVREYCANQRAYERKGSCEFERID